MSEREKQLELRVAELEGELKAYKEQYYSRLQLPQITQSLPQVVSCNHCICHPDLHCSCGKRYKQFGF